ncbi:MAG: hypothetical protein ACE5DM_04785 [Candidatus Nanoarchaeia archaeon]
MGKKNRAKNGKDHKPSQLIMQNLSSQYCLTRNKPGAHFDHRKYDIPEKNSGQHLLINGVSYDKYVLVTDTRGDPMTILCLIPEKGGEYYAVGFVDDFLRPEERLDPQSVRPETVAYRAEKAVGKESRKQERAAVKAAKSERRQNLDSICQA